MERPFNGRCPRCGAGTIVTATGQGGWEEDRECDRGHEFHVSYDHSNDSGTVTRMESPAARGPRVGTVQGSHVCTFDGGSRVEWSPLGTPEARAVLMAADQGEEIRQKLLAAMNAENAGDWKKAIDLWGWLAENAVNRPSLLVTARDALKAARAKLAR